VSEYEQGRTPGVTFLGSMDESAKSINSSLPFMLIASQSQIQPSDLLVFQHILTETEPLTALMASEIIDPIALRFVPHSAWTQQTTSLQSLHDDYFGRKNNVNRRFEHKLWNALRLTSAFPNMTKIIGVVWVNDTIIKVYKYSFAKFLNINAVDGGLFHKQGNFTRHGFVVISDEDARDKIAPNLLVDVDFRDVLLIIHQHGLFTVLSPEETISGCKWNNPMATT
jgi:hypothetical protein